MTTRPPFFDQNIPLATTPTELDELADRFSQYDRYYVRCAAEAPVRQQLEGLWESFAPYADADFEGHYRLDGYFHARTWEMYLGAVLLQHGFELDKATSGGPDVHVLKPLEFWIEAVTASAGTGPDALEITIDPISDVVVREFPEDALLLRFCNAMSAKRLQNARHVERGVVTSDVPYLIAVNTGSLMLPDLDPPVAVRAAFGVGPLAIPIDQPGRQPFYVSRQTVPKAGGAPVPLGLFRSSGYESISGVILSHDNVLTALRNVGGDLEVVHNPMATSPLPGDLFDFVPQWRLIDGSTLRRIRPV